MTQDAPLWTTSKPDDDELTRAIAERWGLVRYLHNQWHIYEVGCWVSRAPQEIQVELRETLRYFRQQAQSLQVQTLEINISQPRVMSVSRMLEGQLYMPDRDYNALQAAQEQFINLKNGLWNLNDFRLQEHDPALMFTTQLDFEYDPTALCPTWERYLRTSLVQPDDSPDEQSIMLLQEAIAYSMTARTDMKASFWLVGKPDSGKSTLAAFIGSLMGSLHTTIDLNQLGGNRFLLSGIVGKRVVTFTEASENSILPDALYKALVGGTDQVYADVKNKPGIAFKPVAKLWWAMNAAPRMTDRSGATLNRLKVIMFDKTISPSARIGNLYERLVEERPGIFNWLMDGYARLQEKGKFTVSDRSEAWREGYRMENDTELTFVNERCAKEKDSYVQAETLYRTYKRWSEENGFRPKNMNQAAKDWERLGFYRTTVNGVRRWHGLRLLPTEDASSY